LKGGRGWKEGKKRREYGKDGRANPTLNINPAWLEP